MMHRLEERRKVKSAAYYERKKVLSKHQSDAQKKTKVDGKITKQLHSYGY
jgi:large subunit ribosomal protein L13Ae